MELNSLGSFGSYKGVAHMKIIGAILVALVVVVTTAFYLISDFFGWTYIQAAWIFIGIALLSFSVLAYLRRWFRVKRIPPPVDKPNTETLSASEHISILFKVFCAFNRMQNRIRRK